MEKKPGKGIKALKWTFFSLAVLTNSFIIVEASLPGGLSSLQSGFFATFFADIINSNHSIPPEVIPVTGVSLSPSTLWTSSVPGYLDDEIPYGCTKAFTATVTPENATDGSVSFAVSDNSAVHLVTRGKTVYCEGLGTATGITLTATASGFSSQVGLDVVPLVAPVDFGVQEEAISLEYDSLNSLGTTSDISVSITNDHMKDKDGNEDDLMSVRYYDKDKLSYSSLDSNVATVDPKGVVRATGSGSTSIRVASGATSYLVPVQVSNTDSLILPTSMAVNGDSDCYVYDMDYDRNQSGMEPGEHHTALSIDWGTTLPSDDSVSWSSSDPLIAQVDGNGYVRGYKKSGDVTITATSNMLPSLSAKFDMSVKEVQATSMNVNASSLKDTYEAGQSVSLKVSFLPINTTNTAVKVVSSDAAVATAIGGDQAVTVQALGKGSVTITVSSSSNPELTYTFDLAITAKGVINEDNYSDFASSVRKVLGHLSLFAVDAVFTVLALYYFLLDVSWKRKLAWISLISMGWGFIVASVSELIQVYVDGRTGSWTDVGIDSLGYLIGTALFILVYFLIRLIKKHHAGKEAEAA